MDKKTVIALVLITVVILALPYYQKLIQGNQPVAPPRVEQKDSLQAQRVTKEKNNKPLEKKAMPLKASQQILKKKKARLVIADEAKIEKTVEIETDKIDAIISNRGGGSFKKFVLKKYSKYDSSLVNIIDPIIKDNLHLAFQEINGSFVSTDSILFHQDRTTSKVYLKNGKTFKIVYTLHYKKSEIIRTFIFNGDYYHVIMVTKFVNPDSLLLNRQYQIGWKNGLPSTESYVSDDNNYNQAYAYMGDELENYSVSKAGPKETETLTGNASWIGIRTKYFLGSLANLNTNVSDGVYFSGRGVKRKDYVQHIYDVGYNARFTNDSKGDSLRLYLGPLDNHELSIYNNNLDVLIMNNGWYERIFRFLTIPLLPVLEMMYAVIPNYGIVIIIFSLLIKLIVYPLTRKSYVSMREMQKIQPLLAEVKTKYKGDPQRLNKETMKLYKEYGVNPLGGCLPTLLQFPLLIALFILFRSTIQLRGAVFIAGWVNDLSRADTLFTLPFSIPFYGNGFNLLPILMAITMIFQSKMTMQDPKQKAMVYVMPIFMLLLFNRFPSGLNLYYTMFNVWTIIQQKFINRGMELETVPAKSGIKRKPKKR